MRTHLCNRFGKTFLFTRDAIETLPRQSKIHQGVHDQEKWPKMAKMTVKLTLIFYLVTSACMEKDISAIYYPWAAHPTGEE